MIKITIRIMRRMSEIQEIIELICKIRGLKSEILNGQNKSESVVNFRHRG